MRQIFPHEIPEVSPADVISSELRVKGGESTRGTSWVMCNMVTSLDGATALDGVSAGLGSDGDKAVFTALRAQADVIVAGSATAKTERYRTPRTPEGILGERRRDRGQSPTPRLCIISNSLRFDADLPFLAHDEPNSDLWPFIATSEEADPSRVEALKGRAHVITAGETAVEPRLLVAALAEKGLLTVLCEGGPSILGVFATAGVLDELNITTPFTLAGGDSQRMIHAATLGSDFELDRLFVTDRGLFSRYLRASS